MTVTFVDNAAIAELSPSSRRAWIEMFDTDPESDDKDVALLAEGVDRNMVFTPLFRWCVSSPSSRRAWIEIFFRHRPRMLHPASPSSRRAWIEMPCLWAWIEN